MFYSNPVMEHPQATPSLVHQAATVPLPQGLAIQLATLVPPPQGGTGEPPQEATEEAHLLDMLGPLVVSH